MQSEGEAQDAAELKAKRHPVVRVATLLKGGKAFAELDEDLQSKTMSRDTRSPEPTRPPIAHSFSDHGAEPVSRARSAERSEGTLVAPSMGVKLEVKA